MDLGLPPFIDVLDSLSPISVSGLPLWEKNSNGSSHGSPKATDVILALGLASVGSALAGAALGGFFVLRESGQSRLPWEDKKLKLHSPLTPSEWSRTFDASSGRLLGGGLKAIGRVRLGGCSNSIRGEVWPFLLGLLDSNSTKAEREEERKQRREKFSELLHLARVITRKGKLEMDKRAKAAAEAESLRTCQQQSRQVEVETEQPREVVAESAEELPMEKEVHRSASEGRLDLVEDANVHPLPGAGTDDAVRGGGGARGSSEVSSLAGGRASGCVSNITEGVELSRAEEREKGGLFNDAEEVSGAPSLESSTESFVHVTKSFLQEEGGGGESEPLGALDFDRGQVQEATTGSRSPEETEPLLVGDSDRSGEYILDDPAISVVSSAVCDVGDVCDEAERDWISLSSSIPAEYKLGLGERGGGLESFMAWRRIMRLDAVRMNSQWVPLSAQSDFSEEEALDAVSDADVQNHEHLSPAQRVHAGRLVPILEAYAVLDPEIGYCQGMTDLLSPFVALILDDCDAFWSFVRFMETARQNFRTDQVGIRKQLDMVAHILEVCDPELYRHLSHVDAQDCIFVYRMVVVLLRRELSFEQTVSLWEVLWAEAAAAAAADAAAAAASSLGAVVGAGAGPYSMPLARADFFLFVIVAILVSHRQTIMQCKELDEVLRLCNSLAGSLDVWDLIRRGRALVCQFSLMEGAEIEFSAEQK